MFKKVISYVLTATLIFESSIVWGQKAVNPPHILFDSAKEYIQNTGLTKKDITYGEWFKKAKRYLDPEIGSKIEVWVKQNANRKMPTFEVVRGKKTDDKTILHVTATQDGKSMNMDVVQTETDVYFVINGVKLTYAELFYGKTIDRVFSPKVTMSALKLKTISKTHPRTTKKYLKALQNYLVSYEQYQDVFKGTPVSQKKVSFIEHILEIAYAAPITNTTCIVAGWPEGKWQISGRCKLDEANSGALDGSKCNNDKTKFYCNPHLFGDGICAPREPATDVSKSCQVKSNVDSIIKEIYEDDKYSRLNDQAETSFNEVLDTCLGKSGQGENVTRNAFAEAITERVSTKIEKAKKLDNLSDSIPEALRTAINRKCTKGSAGGNCNKHNQIACEVTVKQIAELLKAKNDAPTTVITCADGNNLKPTTCPDGSVIEACAVLGKNLCTGHDNPSVIPVDGKPGNGEVTPEATRDPPEAADNENPKDDSFMGGWFGDNWKWLTAGLVGFGAGFLLCRFWLCKDAITKTNTQYVPVPGATKYIPVPGPIQYFVPPEVPPPIPPVIPQEEIEIPREDGQGAR
jgi:hypothetical protein